MVSSMSQGLNRRAFVCGAVLSLSGFGCGSSATGAAQGAAGGGGVPSSTGSAGSMGSGSSGDFVRFVGRMDRSRAAGPVFSWSGSGAVARFRGASISIELNDDVGNQYTVVIDGEERPALKTKGTQSTYELATGLDDREHDVEVYRRTEASFGISQFLAFHVSGGQFLSPPAAPARRIELIGDSISCGYGNLGATASCPFSADTEDHYASYGAVAARLLNAELSTVAWSGKGVVHNYGNDKAKPLPALYELADPNLETPWDFAWQPDAVVINLGTNDFSTDADPTADEFVAGYVAFLERVRSKNPQAFILCTVGPMLTGPDLESARQGIESAVAERRAAGDENVATWTMEIANISPGCDYHPGVATHQRMAEALAAQLRAALAW
jgi:lysophospholipase L1-like esterase